MNGSSLVTFVTYSRVNSTFERMISICTEATKTVTITIKDNDV